MAIYPGTSNVRRTVTFDRPLSGQEITQAVRAICYDQGPRFVQERGYEDGYGEAVSAESAGRRIQVSPSADKTYFSARATYQQVVVVDASETQVTRHPGLEERVNAVVGFAESLEQRLNQQKAPDLHLEKAAGLLQDQSAGAGSRPGLSGERDFGPTQNGQRREHGQQLG